MSNKKNIDTIFWGLLNGIIVSELLVLSFTRNENYSGHFVRKIVWGLSSVIFILLNY